MGQGTEETWPVAACSLTTSPASPSKSVTSPYFCWSLCFLVSPQHFWDRFPLFMNISFLLFPGSWLWYLPFSGNLIVFLIVHFICKLNLQGLWVRLSAMRQILLLIGFLWSLLSTTPNHHLLTQLRPQVLQELCCPLVAQECMCLVASVTLCNSMDYSLPGSFVHGIIQARILQWPKYKLQKTLKINFSSFFFFTNYIKHLKHFGTLNITFREYILVLPIMQFR